MIGKQILNYKITKKIGEGGMATLYEAVHTTFENRKVAIKVLDPILTRNKDIVSRFVSEAKIMANLDHQNIVKVVDFEQDTELMAIIMELLNGISLKDAIRNNNFSEDTNINIFRQVVNAIDYGHNKGVVHRDIKPSNVFLINNLQQAKVLDFGIAKLLNSDNQKTATGLQMGTPMFMSPEQVRGLNSIDHRTDIYSLGVLLYYMFARKTPYDKTASQFDILSKIVNQPIPDLENFPQINRIVKKATAKNPDERYQTCQELLAAIDERNELSGFISVNPDFDEKKSIQQPNKIPEKQENKTDLSNDNQEKVAENQANTQKKEKKQAIKPKKKSKIGRILFFLLLLLLIIWLLSKLGLFNNSKTWQVYFGGDKNEEIYSVTTIKNNVYAVGFSKSYGSSMNWYLTALNKKGKQIWFKDIDAFNRGDAAHAIIPTNDGNLLIVGGAYKNDEYQAQNRVMKISPKGEIIWDKFYGYNGWDEAVDVVAADKGSFIFIFTDNSNAKTQSGVYKIDANGNLIWEQSVGEYADFSPRDIFKVTDNKYIICGKATYSEKTTKAFLFEINNKGKVLWSKTYGDYGKYWDAECVTETLNGDFLLAGYSQEGDEKKLLVFKTNALGVMNDFYIFSDEQQAAMSIKKTDDNNFILAGYTENDNNKDGLIIKMTDNFVVLWKRIYGGSKTDVFRSVWIDDNNIYAAGYTKSHSYNNDKQAWILKLDQNGKM